MNEKLLISIDTLFCSALLENSEMDKIFSFFKAPSNEFYPLKKGTISDHFPNNYSWNDQLFLCFKNYSSSNNYSHRNIFIKFTSQGIFGHTQDSLMEVLVILFERLNIYLSTDEVANLFYFSEAQVAIDFFESEFTEKMGQIIKHLKENETYKSFSRARSSHITFLVDPKNPNPSCNIMCEPLKNCLKFKTYDKMWEMLNVENQKNLLKKIMLFTESGADKSAFDVINSSISPCEKYTILKNKGIGILRFEFTIKKGFINSKDTFKQAKLLYNFIAMLFPLMYQILTEYFYIYALDTGENIEHFEKALDSIRLKIFSEGPNPLISYSTDENLEDQILSMTKRLNCIATELFNIIDKLYYFKQFSNLLYHDYLIYDTLNDLFKAVLDGNKFYRCDLYEKFKGRSH